MGMKVIETNQTINLATYGLKSGDEITVICVGGGAGGTFGGGNNGNSSNGGAGGNPGNSQDGLSGGGAGAGYGAGGGGGSTNKTSDGVYGYGGGAGQYKMTSHKLNATTVNSIAVTIGAAGLGGNANSKPGKNGGVTSFGAILSANGGIVNMGGSPGNARYTYGGCGGGGAGGFLLPLKIYGGAGGDGGHYFDYNKNSNASLPPFQQLKLGGCGGINISKNSSYTSLQASEYGGKPGQKGVMSKGEGVVVVLW